VDPVASKQDHALLPVCPLAELDFQLSRELLLLGEVVVEQRGVDPRLWTRPPALNLPHVRESGFAKINLRLMRDRDKDCPNPPKKRSRVVRAFRATPPHRRQHFAD